MRMSKNGWIHRGVTKKTCEFCLQEFEALKKKTRFCSIRCANKFRRPEYKRKCISCDKVLYYKSPQSYSWAKKNNSKCKNCSHRDRMNKPERIKQNRLKRIQELQNKHGQAHPNYNPLGCRMIEEYGKLHGYNFQHAENGGEFYIKELGYWVDGYDKEQNIVIEYDDKYHNSQSQRRKDNRRQKEIVEYLKCKFIRIGVIHD